MSFCQSIKFAAVLGLATLPTASTTSAHPLSTRRSFIPIPVRSQNKSSTLAIPAKSSVRSRITVPTTVAAPASASMPKKTESSILKHVERIRKTRNAQATFNTSTAFKPKATVTTPAPLRPVRQPASRVSSNMSSSSTSSVARSDRSVDAHIKRITSAREKRTPSSSTPAPSRKVSPVSVDLFAQIEDQLSQLTLAPLAIRKTSPKVPSLRSCLKKGASAVVKHVHFQECNGWNIHGIRAFSKDSRPKSFIPLCEATLLQPTPFEVRDDVIYEPGRPSRTHGLVHEGHYRLMERDREIRWPPPEEFGPITEGHLPLRCMPCAELASMGTPLTRYLPRQVSVRCLDCQSDPGKRLMMCPPLDHDDSEDHLDTCSEQKHTSADCHYQLSALKADIRWLYANYPDRYEYYNNIFPDLV